MTKVMTKTERLALSWLLRQGYGEGDVKFNWRGSPDFLLADGRRVEVKRLYGDTIIFSEKQLGELADEDEVAVFREGDEEPVAVFPFREVKEALRRGGWLRLGDRSLLVRVVGGEMLRIRCGKQTAARFKRLAARFGNYEDCLLSLMDAYERSTRYSASVVV